MNNPELLQQSSVKRHMRRGCRAQQRQSLKLSHDCRIFGKKPICAPAQGLGDTQGEPVRKSLALIMGRLHIAAVRHEHVPMFLMLLNAHRGTSSNAKSEEARFTFLLLTCYQHAKYLRGYPYLRAYPIA